MKNKILLLATHNDHKAQEIAALFAENGLDIQVQTLHDLGDDQPIPEEGHTLEENALSKVRAGHERHGGNVFADDTGLEVVALGGRPGVYTARYAGDHCSSDDNITKLLDDLDDCDDRSAVFKTVIALILNGQEYTFTGEVRGIITRQRRGVLGFGYDPVFMPEGSGVTFAELSEHDKNKISHRGRAIEKLITFLQKIAPENE